MARRRNRKKDPLDLIAPLAMLLLGLGFISPQFRALFRVIPLLVVLALGAMGIFLVVIVILRFRRPPLVANIPPASNVKGAIANLERMTLKHGLRFSGENNAHTRFNRELLEKLEWRRFEILVTHYFQKMGFTARRSSVGADGGVDILVSHAGESQVCAYVQCKAWNADKVGVKEVRELFGVMAADKMPLGYLFATNGFSTDAVRFAQGKPLNLITGDQLLEALNELPEVEIQTILDEITSGDYSTPTCPSCDIRMIACKGWRGPFWGCRNYPRCKTRLYMKAQVAGGI